MKTRIKETINSDGESRFMPQVKLLFWWVTHPRMESFSVGFRTLEEARHLLTYRETYKVKIHDEATR